MKVFKLIKLLSKFVFGVIKLMMKMVLVFTALALIFGIKASLVMTLILSMFIALVFINNLIAVMTEGYLCHKKYKKIKLYDFMKDDPWVPGMPAVTTKAYIQGFFYRSKS